MAQTFRQVRGPRFRGLQGYKGLKRGYILITQNLLEKEESCTTVYLKGQGGLASGLIMGMMGLLHGL